MGGGGEERLMVFLQLAHVNAINSLPVEEESQRKANMSYRQRNASARRQLAG